MEEYGDCLKVPTKIPFLSAHKDEAGPDEIQGVAAFGEGLMVTITITPTLNLITTCGEGLMVNPSVLDKHT